MLLVSNMCGIGMPELEIQNAKFCKEGCFMRGESIFYPFHRCFSSTVNIDCTDHVSAFLGGIAFILSVRSDRCVCLSTGKMGYRARICTAGQEVRVFFVHEKLVHEKRVL